MDINLILTNRLTVLDDFEGQMTWTYDMCTKNALDQGVF